MGAFFQAVIKRGVRLLLPPTCLGCQCLVAELDSLCADCWKDLQFIVKPYCLVMGTPFAYDLGENLFSKQALRHPPPYKRLRSAVVHKGIARRLITSLKYADRPDMARLMAGWMQRAGDELLKIADIIIPIPLHFRRFWVRKYNQSAELARLIARKEGKIFAPQWLVRRHHTRPQVGLNFDERKQNIRGAFYVPPCFHSALKDRRVLVVDDVFTTGATVAAAAHCLLNAGVKQVDVLTFSRALTDEAISPLEGGFLNGSLLS
ncbi:ComF family protein [Bartonella sp. DGB2]|uniref:ComF family protein n=1 Tax=Bartonella sp. DGB2 TaxID=3388426 RepID=UPI00398FAC83